MLTTSDVISDSHVPTTATLSVKNGKASTRLASRDTTDFSAVDIPKRTGLDPLEKKDTQSQDEDLQNSAQTQVIEDVLETTIAPNEETTQDLPKSEREVEDEGDTELEDQSLPSSACLINGDCSPGYKCFEGWCHPGCDKHQDCPKGYSCRYGRWGRRCFAKKGNHRECLEHLMFCIRDFQCCSGYCGRAKGKAFLCWPKKN